MVEKFTTEEINRYRAAFQLFDDDRDGVVTSSQVGVVLRSLGANLTDARIEELVAGLERRGPLERKRKMDPDRVDFPEFLSMMAIAQAEADDDESERQNLMDAFKVFDRHGAGRVSSQELRAVLLSLGETMSPREADLLLRDADRHGDGLIDYGDFITKLCSK